MSHNFIFKRKDFITTNMKDVLDYRLFLQFKKLKYIVHKQKYLFPQPPNHYALFGKYQNTWYKNLQARFQKVAKEKQVNSAQAVGINIMIYWKKYIAPLDLKQRANIILKNLKNSPQRRQIMKIDHMNDHELEIVSEMISWNKFYNFERKCQSRSYKVSDLDVQKIVENINIREQHALKYTIPQRLLDNISNKANIQDNYKQYEQSKYFDRQKRQFNLDELDQDHESKRISKKEFKKTKQLANLWKQDQKALIFLKVKGITEEQLKKSYKISVDFAEVFQERSSKIIATRTRMYKKTNKTNKNLEDEQVQQYLESEEPSEY